MDDYIGLSIYAYIVSLYKYNFLPQIVLHSVPTEMSFTHSSFKRSHLLRFAKEIGNIAIILITAYCIYTPCSEVYQKRHGKRVNFLNSDKRTISI